MTTMAPSCTIRNPQRYCYLVAFFQIFATLLRHGRYVITLVFKSMSQSKVTPDVLN